MRCAKFIITDRARCSVRRRGINNQVWNWDSNKVGASTNVIAIGGVGMVFRLIEGSNDERMGVLGLKPVSNKQP